MEPIFLNSNQLRHSDFLKKRLSDEDLAFFNSEHSFYTAFEFSCSAEIRQEILLLKNQLSMSIEDIKKLYKSGLIDIDPTAESKVTVKMPLRKLIISSLEIVLYGILYFWPIFLLSANQNNSNTMTPVFTFIAFAFVGFCLVYYQYQRNIYPFLVLKKIGFAFGDKYILPNATKRELLD
jgi:hypothetical protein